MRTLALPIILVICSGQVDPTSPAVAPPRDLEDALLDAIRIRPAQPGTTVSESELALIKADVLQSLRAVTTPEVALADLSPNARNEITGRELTLLSTNREYYLAQARYHLLWMVAAARVSQRMPMLVPDEEKRALDLIDELLANVQTSVQQHLGDLLTADVTREYVESQRRTIVRWMRSPLSYWYKRIPTRQQIDAISREFESRLEQTKHRATERAAQELPPKDSDRYERALNALRDQFMMELLVFVDQKLIDATEVKPHFNVEEMVPGFTAAQTVAMEWNTNLRRQAIEAKRAARRPPGDPAASSD